MDKGILIIAVGHGNYGKLAATLAMSIKGNGSKYPIHLVYTEATLKAIGEDYLKFFDSKAECPGEYLSNNGETCYIKVKSHMNDLTPFKETIFLDADIIMINNGMLDVIIEEIKDVDFTIKNSGFTKYDSEKITKESMQWANLLEIKEAYKFIDEEIWNVHSEFIFWKKNKKNDQLFKDWIYNFENLKVSNIEFGGCIPDELPLWIAMIQNKITPHKEMFHPTFWPMDNSKQMRIMDLRNDYCGVSIGGNNLSPLTKNNYDLLVSLFAKITNMRYRYFAQAKKKWLPERHTY
jgi:hypothetical protein